MPVMKKRKRSIDSTLDDFIWQRNGTGQNRSLSTEKQKLCAENEGNKGNENVELGMEEGDDDLKLHADDTDVAVGDYQW